MSEHFCITGHSGMFGTLCHQFPQEIDDLRVHQHNSSYFGVSGNILSEYSLNLTLRHCLYTTINLPLIIKKEHNPSQKAEHRRPKGRHTVSCSGSASDCRNRSKQ